MSLPVWLTRPRLAALLALIVGVGAVAGVGWWAGHDDPVQTPDWSALPMVAPQIAPGPESLPDEQVWALAQLDTCALATERPLSHGNIYRPSALRCSLQFARPDIEVSVDFGTTVDLHHRVRRDIAGYAGWVGKFDNECDVVLPVRQQAAVTFTAALADCGELLARARAVVRRWKADPRAWVRSEPIPHACQLAAAADLAGPYVAGGLTCGLGRVDELGGNTRGVVVDVGGESSFDDDEPATIAGQQVIRSLEAADRYGIDGECSLRWERATRVDTSQFWRDGVLEKSYDDAPLVWATAGDCATARRMAAKLIRADRTWQPPAPPRLLFYRFDEVDHTGIGACRNLADQGPLQCALSVERAVAKDPIEFLRHGEADPDVVCAAARTVAKRLDVEIETVTAMNRLTRDPKVRSCVLVDASHTFEVNLAASRDPLGTVSSSLDEEVSIAGHRAYVADRIHRWTIALDGPQDRGSLAVDASYTGEEPPWLDGFIEELTRQVLD